MLFKPEVGTGWSTVGVELLMYITSSLLQTIKVLSSHHQSTLRAALSDHLSYFLLF